MRLNIGCGTDIKQGWDNLDMHDKFGANIIWDLNRLPLPLESNIYEYIYCSQILEHITNPINLIYELVRICKVNGMIEIIVPNETIAWSNIWHVKAYNIQSFKSLVMPDLEEGIVNDFKIKEIYYQGIDQKHPFVSRMYSQFCKIGANIIGCNLMDSTFMKWLFPMVHIRVIYQKVR